MSAPAQPTRFLPAERASVEQVRADYGIVLSAPNLHRVLDAMPCPALVLNAERQIVYANRAVLGRFAEGPEAVLGRRVGEILDCAHAGGGAGCGTTEFCANCGAAQALAEALRGSAGAQECRILTRDPAKSLDLLAWTTPITVGGRSYILFAALDIGHEKRRRALERLFFHDALNLVAAVQGLAELLTDAEPRDIPDFAEDILRSSQELIDELTSQRDLAAAESGELEVERAPFSPRAVLEGLRGVYRAHRAAKGKMLALDPASDAGEVTASRVLFTRVAANLILNALEAEPAGAKVLMGCRRAPGGGMTVWVKNPSAMPEAVRLQVFERSFSTKDARRGLGAYSAKLLTERYLGGTISFDSVPGRGTEFRVELPAG